MKKIKVRIGSSCTSIIIHPQDIIQVHYIKKKKTPKIPNF